MAKFEELVLLVNSLTKAEKRPVTPIHDSFICEVLHEDELTKAIKEVYKKYSFKVNVKNSSKKRYSDFLDMLDDLETGVLVMED
jgi:hypothetical protein